MACLTIVKVMPQINVTDVSTISDWDSLVMGTSFFINYLEKSTAF